MKIDKFIIFCSKSLDVLKTKLDQVTQLFQQYIQENDKNKNGAEVLDSLISLQSKILAKRNTLEQKTSKINSKIYSKIRLFY